MTELDALRRENERLLEALAYLADCHAATAEKVLMTKRSSQTERLRMVKICTTSQFLLMGDSVKEAGARISRTQAVIQRLRDVSAMYFKPEATA